MNKNPILGHSFRFAKGIVQYCELLETSRKYVIARQLLKAGTSIGANVFEAQSPQSRADFISKMMIAMKEARESEYWLLLCNDCPNYPDPVGLLDHIKEIQKVLAKIISTSKRRN